MKKIVCELCEGTEFTKDGGFFICHGCGTKYTLAEAKSMMVEVEGESAPVVGGAPSPSVPVGNPNQQQIDNLLILATNAREAGNNQEAENYCNQVIALDATSYRAWFLKGQAAGWQSTIKNQRLSEAAHAFAQAYDFAPEEEKEEIKNQAVEELKNLGLACISLRKDRFSKYPDDEELEGFSSDRKNLLAALVVLLSKGIPAGIPDGYQEQIAVMMNQATVAGFNTVRDRYQNDRRPMPNDFQKALNEVDNCWKLVLQAIDASDDDDEADITRYENAIVYLEYSIGMTAYPDYSSDYRSWSLTEEAKKIRRGYISEYKGKIRAIKEDVEEKKKEAERKAEEEKQARIDAYWAEHAEEKAALDAEKAELAEKRDQLAGEIQRIQGEITLGQPKGPVPSEEETEAIKGQIAELEKRRAGLGMFAGKEKKQIAEELATLNGRVEALKEKIEAERKARQAEADEKLAPLHEQRNELAAECNRVEERIAAIEAELSKDPG